MNTDAFFHEMQSFVHRHGAVNNVYLDRFQEGDVAPADFHRFALEFYQFARFFPRILVTQLVNTEDEHVADELTRVLFSELGEGDPRKRHELLYRRFLQSVGIGVERAFHQPMLPSTKAYIHGMQALYDSPNRHTALGASFGLENMAIPMWDHLLPGLKVVRQRWFPNMDMTYFTFHRALEDTHEDAMERALLSQAMSASDRRAFRHGAQKVLDYLEGFWLGLEASGETTPVRTAA